VALNCCVNPRDTDAADGEIEMEVMPAVTVRLVLPEIPALVALIVVVPDWIPLASPKEVIVATVVAEELHETEVVILAVLPSL
jgi:hypothetical protein